MRTILACLALASPALAQELTGDGEIRIHRHEVVVDIHDRVALTTVTQVFANHRTVPSEGTYLFPLPRGASIIDFQMWIDGRTMKGEMLERDKAESVYQRILSRGKDPGILDQINDNIWRVRVFPIPPNEGEVKLQTRYLEILPCLAGVTRYTYPFHLGSAKPQALDAFSFRVQAIAPVPLTRIEGARMSVVRKSPSEFTATLDRERADFRKDLELSFESGDAPAGLSLMAHRRAGEDGHFLLSVRPDLGTVAEAELPREVLYLIDASGSIDEKLLRRVAAAVTADARVLSAHDRFNIVTFNTRLERFQAAAVPSTPESARQAGAFLDKIKPQGRTNLEGCLPSILAEGGDTPRIVFLITDGSPSAGRLPAGEIAAACLEKCPASTMIFPIPVGEAELPLLETLAARTGGRLMSPGTEGLLENLQLVHERLARPLMTDVQVDLGHAGAYRVHQPRLLFRNEPILVSGRYRTPGTHEVRLSGRIGGRSVVLRQEMNFPALEERWGAAAYVWAGHEISSLLADLCLGGDESVLRPAAVQLSKDYRISTPFTAFLVLENDVMYAQFGLPRIPVQDREVFLKPPARKLAPAPKPLIEGVQLLPVLWTPSGDALLPALKWFGNPPSASMATSQGICPLSEKGVQALALMALLGADAYILEHPDRTALNLTFKRVLEALLKAQAADGSIGNDLDHALATEALGRVLRERGQDRQTKRALQRAVAYLSDHLDRRTAALAGPALVLARDLKLEVDAETLEKAEFLIDPRSEALYVRGKMALDPKSASDPKVRAAIGRLLQQDVTDPATAFLGSEAILSWRGDQTPEWRAWERKLDGYRRIKAPSGSWLAKGWSEDSRGASTAFLALLLELHDGRGF